MGEGALWGASALRVLSAVCDLDIDPNETDGTTRERFIRILEHSDPSTQAKIIRGVLTRFPTDSDALPGSKARRTRALHDEFVAVAERLERSVAIPSPALAVSSDVVERALKDAAALIATTGPTSAVDRVHTALHGYLRAICSKAGLSMPADPTIPALLKVIRQDHPAFAGNQLRAEEITRVLRTLGGIVDAMNPLRNHASVAHPNDELLEAPEAGLVIHSARSILHSLNARIPT